jgi:PAS domain S-box-containing protein
LADNNPPGGEEQPRSTPGDTSRNDARISAELAGLDDGTDPFTAAVRATRMPMIITNPRDADNPIVFANDAFCRFTGYAREEILGRNCRFLQGPESDPATVDRIRAAIKAREPIEIDIRNHAKDGRPFWNRLLIAPVYDANGTLAYFFASQFDVTVDRENLVARTLELAEANDKLRAEAAEREQVEEALRQSQKMEAVGQLTGGLAHDFNNLLTGITGSLELLQIRLVQGRLTDFERYITAAQGAAKRAAALTHRLLAFSRRQTLAPKPTDVNRLVTGMEEMIRRTVGPEIALEVVTAGGLWNTLIDPNQLENALLNLCINARDAMPESGQLTIETGNKWLDVRAAQDRDLPAGQYVSLCVSDTGTGMPPEVIQRAFDPFFTTKPIGMGTGLGLSMVYGFVRQSGGQARIYSEPGQGTMVCLYLPRQFGGTETVEEAADPMGAPRTGQGETVLVVDDEPTVRMLVSDVLEDLGYIAIEVADGAAGLRVLQSDARIDLLVTDVGLPGGMNGRQVADAGRALRPGLKVLFITGYAENAVLSHGHLDPGMHVVTKPFAMDALATRIKELITAP